MFIELNHLNFRYKKNKQDTIRDFTFSIKKGEVVCLLGKSGSGKSTVLRLISGLELPGNGQIKLNGRVVFNDSFNLPPEKRKVGMVFQDYALFPHMTVAENIKYGMHQIEKGIRKERLAEVLSLVELEELADRFPYQLSGGQQQRTALARAVAPKPEVLLLDEPFSNLDASLKEQIRKKLKQIINEIGITTIIVSHDIDDALDLADRLVVIKEGEIVQAGLPAEIIKNPGSDYVAGIVEK